MERILFDKPETELRLNGRGLYDIANYRPGTVIFCQKGTIWVTQTNDVKDHILNPGDEFVSDVRGRVIIQAMRDSAVRIGSRQPRQAGRRSSLSQGKPA